jgi:hypothetical protein
MRGKIALFNNPGVRGGVGFGAALAIAISYSNWGSVLWAILHGIFGWFYVIYFFIVHNF